MSPHDHHTHQRITPCDVRLRRLPHSMANRDDARNAHDFDSGGVVAASLTNPNPHLMTPNRKAKTS